MATNGFNGWAKWLLGVLVTAAIIGGVKLAIAQGQDAKQTGINTEEIAKLREAVAAIPVIQTDMRHVRIDISKIEAAITKIAEEGD